MPIDVKSSDKGHDNSIQFGGRTATTLDFGRGLIFLERVYRGITGFQIFAVNPILFQFLDFLDKCRTPICKFKQHDVRTLFACRVFRIFARFKI